MTSSSGGNDFWSYEVPEGHATLSSVAMTPATRLAKKLHAGRSSYYGVQEPEAFDRETRTSVSSSRSSTGVCTASLRRVVADRSSVPVMQVRPNNSERRMASRRCRAPKRRPPFSWLSSASSTIVCYGPLSLLPRRVPAFLRCWDLADGQLWTRTSS